MRHRREPTRNRMGWTSNLPNELSQRFIDACPGLPNPVLDIGAALGVATLPALARGAVVLANDLDPAHLKQLLDATPEPDRSRLTLLPGRFPGELNLEPGSLSSVHISNVLHFLTGAEIEEGLAKIGSWLRPRGTLYVQAGTPFQQPFLRFIPEYEQRVREGARWPGWITSTAAVSSHRKLDQIPRSLHLLDDTVLSRAAREAGLRVEQAWMYRRRDLPKSMHHDGREGVGLIAEKSD